MYDSQGILFGALINKVTRLIENRNPHVNALRDKTTEFKQFLEVKKNIPAQLKLQAKVR